MPAESERHKLLHPNKPLCLCHAFFQGKLALLFLFFNNEKMIFFFPFYLPNAARRVETTSGTSGTLQTPPPLLLLTGFIPPVAGTQSARFGIVFVHLQHVTFHHPAAVLCFYIHPLLIAPKQRQACLFTQRNSISVVFFFLLWLIKACGFTGMDNCCVIKIR